MTGKQVLPPCSSRSVAAAWWRSSPCSRRRISDKRPASPSSSGNVFVAFAGLFRDQPQVLAAAATVFLRLSQIVNDALALQMLRQSLPAASLLVWGFVRFRPGARIAIQVIVVLVGSRFAFHAMCPPGRLEQCQLLFRQLLTLAFALRFQQFAQQTLILVLFSQGMIQLRG